MKHPLSILALGLIPLVSSAIAQDRPSAPPQAYEDCRGKKAGDTVQHTTREGVP